MVQLKSRERKQVFIQFTASKPVVARDTILVYGSDGKPMSVQLMATTGSCLLVMDSVLNFGP